MGGLREERPGQSGRGTRVKDRGNWRLLIKKMVQENLEKRRQQ